ncbi:MAG: TetR/AcrR family transcriptional regulator [Anaerolineae bacterium]|nr:TetR/AcrR family transcriptional regulator [Anaerolineae bacterium]
MPKIAASQREQYVRNRREQILDAAMLAFAKKGFDATSVSEIAQQAGLAKGTIYLYFSSKEDIFSAILDERSFVGQLTNLLEDLQMPVDQVLTRVAEQYYQYMEQYLPILRLAIAEACRFPNHVSRVYQEIIQRGVEMLANYLTRLSQKGVIRALDNPHMTARAFMGLLSSYVMTQELLGGSRVAPVERALWIEEGIRLFVEGIRL